MTVERQRAAVEHKFVLTADQIYIDNGRIRGESSLVQEFFPLVDFFRHGMEKRRC